MTCLLAALGLILAGGVAALLSGRSGRRPPPAAVAAIVFGAALGCVPAFPALSGAAPLSLHVPWSVPNGDFVLELDALSAWFLLPIFGLSAVAAVYGVGYLASAPGPKPVGLSWFFYAVLVASMALVVLARNAVLFLVAWEVMALASFFLVTFDDEAPEVRRAGWVYLVATHLGTASLLTCFVIAARETGSTNFADWTALATRPTGTTGLLFVLAVVGFGAKAGLVPFHVWLPEAHPAAPSHVSAVMSGVMIKTGIYGLLRLLTFLGPPPPWWGGLLLAAGLISALTGVLFALAQSDLKRLLAYSSVENIGVITLALGAGLLGLGLNQPFLAVLGFAGGLLHVVNHALFKGSLFLAAGSVAHATGTRQLDALGGLSKSMPWTAAVFLTGSVAICALPPFNGFVSEWLILLGGYQAVTRPGVISPVIGLLLLTALALLGGLAAAAFAKAFGSVFLGEPRQPLAPPPHEAGPAMRWPMAVLAGGCLLLGLTGPLLLPAMKPLLQIVTQLRDSELLPPLELAERSLLLVSSVGLALVALAATFAWVRRKLVRRHGVSTAGTWDCGYTRPTPRIQYTGASFVQPITALFRWLLRSRVRLVRPEGLFPTHATHATDTPDVCQRELFRPLFHETGRGLSRFRWLQHGQVQLYVLYIAVTLVALMLWKLR